jgi:hypothetical protein
VPPWLARASCVQRHLPSQVVLGASTRANM